MVVEIRVHSVVRRLRHRSRQRVALPISVLPEWRRCVCLDQMKHEPFRHLSRSLLDLTDLLRRTALRARNVLGTNARHRWSRHVQAGAYYERRRLCCRRDGVLAERALYRRTRLGDFLSVPQYTRPLR